MEWEWVAKACGGWKKDCPLEKMEGMNIEMPVVGNQMIEKPEWPLNVWCVCLKNAFEPECFGQCNWEFVL